MEIFLVKKSAMVTAGFTLAPDIWPKHWHRVAIAMPDVNAITSPELITE